MEIQSHWIVKLNLEPSYTRKKFPSRRRSRSRDHLSLIISTTAHQEAYYLNQEPEMNKQENERANETRSHEAVNPKKEIRFLIAKSKI